MATNAPGTDAPVTDAPTQSAPTVGAPSTPAALPPGPDYPRIVQAWLWLKQPTWFLDRCYQEFGDVFTMRLPLGMNLIHISEPGFVKAIFGGDNDALRAGEANATILEPIVGPNSVLILDGPEHLRQRKLILPAFHGERMRTWEATIQDITRSEIDQWPMGKHLSMRTSMQSVTLDVILRLIFGVDEGARKTELRRLIVKLSQIGSHPFSLFATRDRNLGGHAPWARFLRARRELDSAVYAEISARRNVSDLEERDDVLSQLLLARDETGRAMGDEEVRDELVTLLFAGHETTATSLAWAFELLLHNPAALGRLTAEILDGGSEYLDAVIKETLRMRPVVAIVDRHVKSPVTIGDHTIPAGAMLCPNIYLTQRRVDLYPDPDVFRPERFLGQAPPPFGWLPFGGGIRRCLGATFATFEMRIVISEILKAFELQPASFRRSSRVRREAVTLVPHDGARFVVKRHRVPEHSTQ